MSEEQPTSKPSEHKDEQSAAQHLSNRTILRFQELAKELRQDLEAIPSLLPGSLRIKDNGVLFISADRSEWRFVAASRYYNLRLLKCFKFTNSVWGDKVWSAIQNNVEEFECLFKVVAACGTSANRFDDFKKAVTSSDQKLAHNLLIDAIAVFPYTGVLPGALDSLLMRSKVNWSSPEEPKWFKLYKGKKCTLQPIIDFDLSRAANALATGNVDRKPISMELFPSSMQFCRTDLNDLQRLYFNFIDYFLLLVPLEKDERSVWTPFAEPSSSQVKTVAEDEEIHLQGFAVPLYDFWDSKSNPVGGFEGWVVVQVDEQRDPGKPNNSLATTDQPRTATDASIVSEEQRLHGGDDSTEELRKCQEELRKCQEELRKCQEELANLRIRAIREALQKFALQINDERMRELVEREWADTTSPEEFALKHYQYFGGWCGEELLRSGQPRKGLDDLQNECISFGHWEKGTWTIIEGKDKASITHIAIQLPAENHKAQRVDHNDTVFILRKQLDTILPSSCKDSANEDLDDYGFHIARSLKDLYQAAKLRKAERNQGLKSGFLASAHDYSKDIGSVLLRLSDFKSDLDRSFQAVKEQARQLSGLPTPASEVVAGILSELRSWTVPRFDWFQGVRFTNAHLATQTRGILVPEPIECVASLERGSLRDIYDVVRLLVWHPITLKKFKERGEEFAKFATDKLRLPSTWWTLFSFDLDPSPASQPFHEKLGQRVLTLILDEKITQPDLTRRFKIPRINPGIELDDPRSILWPDGEPDRWRPLDGLLPLFVFSMRFAFQCAWARTLLNEPKEPLSIEIAASRTEDRRYELRITFPSLLPVGARLDDHPYYGEWKAQVAHYTGTPIWKTSPWKALAETHAVTQEDGDARCQITLAASI